MQRLASFTCMIAIAHAHSPQNIDTILITHSRDLGIHIDSFISSQMWPNVAYGSQKPSKLGMRHNSCVIKQHLCFGHLEKDYEISSGACDACGQVVLCILIIREYISNFYNPNNMPLVSFISPYWTHTIPPPPPP